ncbi:MAG: nickel/cobalt efflux transporter RcnA [Proteobacteria bacterium]|nr:nickel/cobalt efflux transporter RcnA [Pseudomonadota bacterium]
MPTFTTLLQQGNSWLFVPTAMLLGALHGLEPGHSKTMMAAFIIAVRGTLGQAVLLGLAATVSHTAIVWLIGLAGLYFGRRWNTEATEPYLQLISAVLIIAVALWMLWRTWSANAARHAHEHDHHHHDGPRRIDTGHGVFVLALSSGADGAHFCLHAEAGPLCSAEHVQVETERADGSREVFTFKRVGDHLVSAQTVAAPHEFVTRLRLGHGGHLHDYDLEFVEGGHRHAIQDYDKLDVAAPGYQDPHELAHANDIRRRFTNREVTTGQIVLFGLTGGLLPCPAAVTVLLLCLQLKKLALGVTLVLGFSLGLAATMVTAGAVAALGVKHLSRHFGSFTVIAQRAPYFSGALILLLGIYLGYQGVHGLS